MTQCWAPKNFISTRTPKRNCDANTFQKAIWLSTQSAARRIRSANSTWLRLQCSLSLSNKKILFEVFPGWDRIVVKYSGLWGVDWDHWDYEIMSSTSRYFPFVTRLSQPLSLHILLSCFVSFWPWGRLASEMSSSLSNGRYGNVTKLELKISFKVRFGFK